MIGRLVAKPGNLREICDSFRDQEKKTTRVDLGADFPPDLSKNRGTVRLKKCTTVRKSNYKCHCRPIRSLKKRTILWESLDIFCETLSKRHLPGCPLYSAVTTNQRLIRLRYAGLSRLLSSAIGLTFTLFSGAGAYSLSPTFTYYPTVDESTAPAFRILNVVTELFDLIDDWGVEVGDWTSGPQWENFIMSGLARIVKLFQDRKASPLAVSSENKTLNHYVASLVSQMYRIHLLPTTYTWALTLKTSR